jgi:hypothetical protein
MKFKVQTQDLVGALNLVSTIKPIAVDSQGSSGYLCVVRGAQCFIYSEDERQRVRVPVPIFDVEGEGAFVYPAGHNDAFKYMEGPIEFEPGEDEGAKIVNCRRTSGDKEALYKISSFDPRALQSLDKDFNGAKEAATFSVALLKEALSVTRPYLADPKDTSNSKPFHQNVQLFDASKEVYKSGNGYMIGSTGQRACLFYSKDLQGKGLVIHGLRIPLLQSFLSKSEGEIKAFHSENSTYFVNAAEQVIGWADQTHTYDKFGFYALSMDRYILKVNRKALENEIRSIRSLIPPEKDKIRLQYDHAKCLLTVLASNGATDLKSLPLAVEPVACDEPDLSKMKDVGFNINADWLLDIISPLKHGDVELRIAPVKDHADRFLVRTIDAYGVDARGKVVLDDAQPGQQVHSCRVMRFIPSKH